MRSTPPPSFVKISLLVLQPLSLGSESHSKPGSAAAREAPPYNKASAK